jgi:uncharacterized membrane protein
VLQRNIEALVSRQAEEARQAPWSDRVAAVVTGFTGSMTFVGVHLAVYGGWILVNLGWLPILPRFDPTFVILAMIASVEALFLSTFVLISQNRMARIADQRADLDVQINLLAEHEIKRLLHLSEAIAEHLGIEADAPAPHHARTAPEQVLDEIETRRRADPQDAGSAG